MVPPCRHPPLTPAKRLTIGIVDLLAEATSMLALDAELHALELRFCAGS
jgi:hypothetical protein